MGFSLCSEPIDKPTLAGDAAAGGCVTFIGRVRYFNDGRKVLALEYESFDELALAEGSRILQEALERFPILRAACRHRIGTLQIGEAAIHVEVLSGHRGEAFEACRWIVDEIKSRVPIWKKEHYEGGATEWLVPNGG